MRTLKSLSVLSLFAAFALTGFAEDEVGVLPSEFYVLDHVSFTGGTSDDAPNYIKTGLTPKSDWKIQVVFAPELTGNTAALWCARLKSAKTDDAAQIVFFYNTASGHPRQDFCAAQTTLTGVTLTSGRKYVFTQDGNEFFIDDDKIVTGTETEFTAGGELALLGSYTSGATPTPKQNGACGKLYGAKVWNGAGELVMNIVPCLKRADGSVVFYDTVGSKELTKAGTFYSNNHKTWKSDVTSGDFTAGSSWTDGLPPQNYDMIEFSDVATTVTFPTDAEQTTFAGPLCLKSPSPTSASPMREVVFDTRGTAFNYYMEFTTQPFVQGWSWSNNKWNSGANAIYVYKGPAVSNVYTPDNLAFSDYAFSSRRTASRWCRNRGRFRRAARSISSAEATAVM